MKLLFFLSQEILFLQVYKGNEPITFVQTTTHPHQLSLHQTGKQIAHTIKFITVYIAPTLMIEGMTLSLSNADMTPTHLNFSQIIIGVNVSMLCYAS